MKKIFITGAAGFLGFSTAKRLLESGHQVVAIDNLNPYYSVKLKEARLAILKQYSACQFERVDLMEKKKLRKSLVGSNQNMSFILLRKRA
ncbi:NAD-dependent epimerase/dehydratase family protein [Methylacidiphilum kamchatkense Kam1]|uniref:NAD-dependent epimerase/dehydratase family protein n=1 Tax=Methylacidiphilum kamchatkense Kam1 TaxID=1202785 RepID=A0A516TKD4_9BACT|nr:NAD-dependent epimerase/dehydratase family protein [Methylacidiphilum kamchatkense Kam1]